MGIKHDKSLSAAELRRQAEERLLAKSAQLNLPGDEEEPLRLLHELQVHQIELEMQNSELSQARQLLETALNQYSDLYDYAPVGYFTLDRAGRIRTANLSAAGLLGIERPLLIGQHLELFVADEAKSFFSEFMGKVFASPDKISCEVGFTRVGNSPLFVQIEAVAFESDKECRVAVIDITERRQVEEALRLEKIFTDSVINSMPGIFYVFDDNRQLIRWNMKLKEFSGCSPEGMPTLRPHDFVAEENHDLLESKLREVFVEHRNTDAELLLQNREKQKISFYCTGSPMRVSDKTYLIGMGIDISERKQAEMEIERLNADVAARAAALEDVNRELEAFNYTVAHDLRNPLNVISSYCQVLMKLCGDNLDEQCRRYIRETYNGTLRMNRLIEALLNFSRLTHVETLRETVDLSAMAHEVARELRLAEPERRTTFLIADGVNAYVDAALVRVVLNNLLGNAWKYTGTQDEGIIEFGTMEVDGRPAYFVRDNGAGFDMADADKLFTPFQRLPGAEECRGFGIGLATVERIIRRHNGRVWAEGEPGRGACFFFTLLAD